MNYFSDLVEDADFYWENGKCVFTSAYLLKRGFCCGSGCRHCPYGNAPQPENSGGQSSNR